MVADKSLLQDSVMIGSSTGTEPTDGTSSDINFTGSGDGSFGGAGMYTFRSGFAEVLSLKDRQS
jgi:hypothetical protein